MTARKIELLSRGPLSLQSNVHEILGLFRQFPEHTAQEMRDMIGRWFGRHRRELVGSLDSRKKRITSRAYFYRVYPTEAQRKKGGFGLEDIKGTSFTWSQAFLALETGATIRPTQSKFLAVPVGKWRRRSIAQRRTELGFRDPRDAQGDERLIPIHRKRKGGAGTILARQLDSTDAEGKKRLEAVFVLKREVRIGPQIGVFDTWDGLEGYRQQTLREHLDRVLERAVRDRSTDGTGLAA